MDTMDAMTTPPGAGRPAKMRRSRGLLGRYWWVAGLVIAGLMVIVLVPLASPDPDGLGRVARDRGFLAAAHDAVFSIIPDYTIPGIGGNLSTILAGLIGVAIVFAAVIVLGRVLARRRVRG
jgi:cobalt/nickel transport system permease protein